MEEPLTRRSRGKPSFSRLASVNENVLQLKENFPSVSSVKEQTPSLLSSREHFPSVSDNEDNAFEEEKPTKKKISRRQSRSNVLLGALKKELKDISVNPAVLKHRKSIVDEAKSEVVNSNLQTFNESMSNFSWPRRRRYSSVGGLHSRHRRRSSVSSEASGEVLLTDRELRKINMLQTLQNMGIKLPKRSTFNQSQSFNEVEIIENMQGKRRRSLTSRMLEATKLVEKRPQRVDPIIREVTEITDVSDLIASSSDERKVNVSRQSSASSEGQSVTSRSNFKTRHRASIAGTALTMEGAGNFKRRIRRRKTRPIQKFKRVAKFLVVLLRSWRAHAQSVHEILLSFDNLDAVANTKNEEVELLFDITDYKAGREASISKELKRILSKKPAERSKEEIYYIQIALRNYPSIVEYPVHMQRMLAERAWYESYDAKRIIVREGHVPMCFYFILTGSGVVSAMDRKSNQRKTLLLLNRGDSFGEQAIMTRSLRQTTVISRERIELLTIGDNDFVDIFMSGGLRDPDDSFIKSIAFLEEWPVELLAKNPKKAIFSYFKRNRVLVADSWNNDWIFIVKSGSCKMLKKLDSIKPEKTLRKKPKHLTWRETVEQAKDQDKSLSHNEQLAMLCEEEIKRIEEVNANMHFFALPEINIATNAAYTQLREEHEKVYQIINQNTVTRALNDLKNLNIAEDQITNMTGANSDKAPKEQRRRMSITDLGNLMLKAPHLARDPKNSASTDRKDASTMVYPVTETETEVDYEEDDEEEDEEEEENEERPYTSSTRKGANDNDKVEDQPVFVNVRTLTKGEVFGLQDVVYENQASFSLVSNGVEVIMINKKFFTDQLNNAQFVRLRDKVFPHPSEQNLKDELTTRISWEYHKKVSFMNALRNAAIRKQNIHDCRSYLTIPPVAT